MENGRNLGLIGHAPGFFFDDAGQNQRLVGRCQCNPPITRRPGRFEALVHGAQGALQHLGIRCAARIAVGVREKAPLRRQTGTPEQLHQLGIAQGFGGGFQALGSGERLAHLAEVPTLHQRHGAHRHIRAGQLAQQLPGRDRVLKTVAARLNSARLARYAKPGVQRIRVQRHTGLLHQHRHLARAHAGFHLQLNAARGQLHHPTNPPNAHAPARHRQTKQKG